MGGGTSPIPNQASDDASLPVALVRPLRLSIVTCAYNEEANIGRFLRGCQTSGNGSYELVEIVVVASGCTDRTEEVVQAAADLDPRVRLIKEPARTGKAAALALGLKDVVGDVVLIAGSDTSPATGALSEAVRPFSDPKVSLVCTRPVPLDNSNSFAVRLARTMWEIHHAVSLMTPKPGEAFAIRNRGFNIPADVQDDDTYLGTVSVLPGTKSVYAEKSVFFNRVPTTVPDFLRQRWRINRQQLGLTQSSGIVTATWRPQFLAGALERYLREHPRSLSYVVVLAGAEGLVKLGALVTGVFVRKPLVQWAPIQSTKQSIVSTTESESMESQK
jgi:poly-beta-1,6-N-acetyl-D-glucosamine synthase